MKMLKHYLLASAATLLFMACGGGNTNSGEEARLGVAETAAASSTEKSKSKKYNVKCFEDFDYDYSKMLTMEDILKHVPVSDPGAIELKYKESRVSKEHNECSYKWPSDRPDMIVKVKAGSNTMEMPRKDENIVAIERFGFSKNSPEQALSSFERAYGQLSEKEYQEMEARIDQQFRDKPEEERKSMKSMVKARQNMKFHPVANVGNSAYWEREAIDDLYFGTKFYVLAGTAEFRLKVKVGSDDEENARVAALLAREILAKCE